MSISLEALSIITWIKFLINSSRPFMFFLSHNFTSVVTWSFLLLPVWSFVAGSPISSLNKATSDVKFVNMRVFDWIWNIAIRWFLEVFMKITRNLSELPWLLGTPSSVFSDKYLRIYTATSSSLHWNRCSLKTNWHFTAYACYQSSSVWLDETAKFHKTRDCPGEHQEIYIKWPCCALNRQVTNKITYNGGPGEC